MLCAAQAQNLGNTPHPSMWDTVNGFKIWGWYPAIDSAATYSSVVDSGFQSSKAQDFHLYGNPRILVLGGDTVVYHGSYRYELWNIWLKTLRDSINTPDSISVDMRLIHVDGDLDTSFSYLTISGSGWSTAPALGYLNGKWVHFSIPTGYLANPPGPITKWGKYGFLIDVYFRDSLYSGIVVRVDNFECYKNGQVIYQDTFGDDSIADIVPPMPVVPANFHLYQNYPNPFNPSTRIDYDVAKAGDVKLSVFNTLGQEVSILVDGYQSAGRHTVVFDASHLASGTYFYILTSGSQRIVKKMVLLK